MTTILSETKATCPSCGASISGGKIPFQMGCGHARLIAGKGATTTYNATATEVIVYQ